MNDRNETAETAATPRLSPDGAADRASRYVARMLQQHLADDPAGRAWEADGTAAFADISGFTQLSEALARKGREGAEQITDIIGHVFEALLGIAYENGGSLLKFGGDALLLWFDGDGHVARASRAAVLMRETLARVGSITLPDATVTLRIAQGVHTGRFHFFAVGESHLELLTTGPSWSRLVTVQDAAAAGEIVVSGEAASALPAECLGETKGAERLLEREPAGTFEKLALRARPVMTLEVVSRCLPKSVREHLRAGTALPEHRPVTIAFIRYGGIDALIELKGKDVAADALQQLLTVVEHAAEAQDVSFLATDVDVDGGKLILAAGAPKVTGDDEERMLLVLRKIVEGKLPLPIHIGVNRGAVFAGDIGPAYRRTYTVMGDAVNLAARLMAQEEPSAPAAIYATGDVLNRSKTTFETTALEPFNVKGKTEPIHAWSVGRAQGSRTRAAEEQRLPLTGRNAELGIIRKAFTSARGGEGRLVDVVGEAGVGKTRLLEALRDAAAGFRKLHASCEAYTASTPYAVWRELLRESMGFGRDDPDAAIAERLRGEVAARTPDLLPWFPLIAIVFGVDVESTPEVDMLAESNRRAKLHEAVGQFLQSVVPERALVEIENAHHMDVASAELLTALAKTMTDRPWLVAVARRPSDGGFRATEGQTVVRVELRALAAGDALRLAQLATKDAPLPEHVLQTVATRSGGNPQFLRDLLRTAIASGGVADLPDSAEAATMAQIDALAPEDRALVRRASVFGLTFHPRMLEWLAVEGEYAPPDTAAWDRLREFFDEEADGYLRFRRALLRDAAYEGLPFKLRRQLHGAIAARLAKESDASEQAGTLALHYYEAGEYQPAWRYAKAAAKAADAVYAYVEAARLYARALDAGKQLEDLGKEELVAVHEAMGDSWYQSGEFGKASEAYLAARPLVASDRLKDSGLVLKISHVEDKLGNYSKALEWTEQSRELLQGLSGADAARQSVRSSALRGFLLRNEGRTAEAIDCAERTVPEAEAVGDMEALGDAFLVIGWATGDLGKEGATPFLQKALEAYKKAGNLGRQAIVMSNLGIVSQAEGRWDEALSYYERSREMALQIGSSVDVAVARINISEILIDRGEWAEAETVLLAALPFWKSSQYHYFLGACLLLLGRVSLRLERLDEARTRLEEAKSNFQLVGAEPEIPLVDARLAECDVAQDKLEHALEMAASMLDRAGSAASIDRVVPLLERIRGHALLKQDDLWTARDALDASLKAAQERNDRYEATLTMLSLIELDRLEGIEPPLDMVEETRSFLAQLKIRAVPPVPLPAR